LIENGIGSYSQAELDTAYSSRDDEWDKRASVDRQFRLVIDYLRQIPVEFLNGSGRRLRNQADFYSLFGALVELLESESLPSVSDLQNRLGQFFTLVSDDKQRSSNSDAASYYEAARSASSDVGPRRVRVAIVRRILAGE
jgi:hypothetical protein